MKTLKIMTAIAALLALGACATAPQEWKDAAIKAARQQIVANAQNLDTACRNEMYREFGRALAKAEVAEVSPLQWRDHYAEPECETKARVMGKINVQEEVDARPVALPQNIGATMADATNMERKDLYNHPVHMAIAAKGIAAVLGRRDVEANEFRYEQLRADRIIDEVLENERQVIASCRLSAWIAPLPGRPDSCTGYRTLTQSCTGAFGCAGVEWRLVTRTHNTSARVHEKAHPQSAASFGGLSVAGASSVVVYTTPSENPCNKIKKGSAEWNGRCVSKSPYPGWPRQ